jgi:DNA-binding NarL/FixJ family response regulator
MMRLLIVADNAFVAEAIRRNVRHASALEVLGWVDGRRACAAEMAEANADAIVVDEMTLMENAVARVREARKSAPEAKVIVLASQMEPAMLAELVDAGAHAAIAKAVHAVNIGVLVREICAGGLYHAFASHVPAERPSRAHTELTQRELEILRLVAEGASNAAIARRLWVTEQTVKFHLSNVYRKLGVANRTEASHYAHVHRLVDSSPAPIAPVARKAA